MSLSTLKILPIELQTGSKGIKLQSEKNKYSGIVILSTFALIRQRYALFSTFTSKEDLDKEDGLNMEDQQVMEI